MGFCQLLVPMSRNITGQDALALTGLCWSPAAFMSRALASLVPLRDCYVALTTAAVSQV